MFGIFLCYCEDRNDIMKTKVILTSEGGRRSEREGGGLIFWREGRRRRKI